METTKIIGKVLWFINQATGEEYGFIYTDMTTEYYFNKSMIAPSSLSDLSLFVKNAIVIFDTPNKISDTRKKATNVHLLQNFNDFHFLISYLKNEIALSQNIYTLTPICDAILNRVKEIRNLSPSAFDSYWYIFQNDIVAICDEKLPELIVQINYPYKSLIKFLKTTLEFSNSMVSLCLSKHLSTEVKFELWLNDYLVDYNFMYISTHFLEYQEHQQLKILQKLTIDDASELLLEKIKNLEYPYSTKDSALFYTYLALGQKTSPILLESIVSVIIPLLSNELVVDLWLKDYTSSIDFNKIAGLLLSLENDKQHKILRKLNPQDLTTLFQKIIYDLDDYESQKNISLIYNLIDLAQYKSTELLNTTMSYLLPLIPDYLKLELWLKGLHENLDFHSYKLYVITLPFQDQKLFIKKVASYIALNKVNLSFEDFSSVVVFDYNTYLQDSSKSLDYSISIIFHIISELRNSHTINVVPKNKEQTLKIFEIVLSLIKDPKDLLYITGFFDLCKGYTFASESKGEFILSNNPKYKPRNHEICDGRIPITKDGTVLKDDKSKLCYWWCAYRKCFESARKLKEHYNWQYYSIVDFLHIFKVPYNERDLEVFLSLINKTNRFFKHMKCRSCNHILHPTRGSNYAFFGVNNFCCKNSECIEKDKEIYITHCLNGHCDEVIDSRDSVKCKPEGYDQNISGWYICNYCHSCCSSEAIERRKVVFEDINKIQYPNHLIGHKDLNQVCCNKCGTVMEQYGDLAIRYNKVLNWLNENKLNQSVIRSFGTNQSGKTYYLLQRRSLTEEKFKWHLKYYKSLGFNIPDIDIDKDVQLISEPFKAPVFDNKLYHCTQCNIYLDLETDMTKRIIFNKYHKPEIL